MQLRVSEIPTINRKRHRLAKPPSDNILSPTGVVGCVNQAGLVDDETALTRDNKVDISISTSDLYLLSVFQPEYLKWKKMRIINIQISLRNL